MRVKRPKKGALHGMRCKNFIKICPKEGKILISASFVKPIHDINICMCPGAGILLSFTRMRILLRGVGMHDTGEAERES